MTRLITEATERAIVRDLLDLTKSVKDVIAIYRDVCSEQFILEIGREYNIDWELRTSVTDTLLRRDQLDAVIVELENSFFDKVKRDEDEEVERQVRYNRSYRRTRRAL